MFSALRRAVPLGGRRFSAAAFQYEELFQQSGALPHSFRKLTSDYVSTFEVQGKQARAPAGKNFLRSCSHAHAALRC